MKFNVGYKIIINLLVIIAICSTFWYLRDCRVKSLIKSEKAEISEVIQNTIRDQVNLKLLLPQLVFINVDGDSKKRISDSVINQIAEVLSQKYTQKDIKPSDLEITPYFLFPTKPDKLGRYTLTDEQLEQFKNHLNFLASQVDKSVLATKEEIDRDISRLNMWVSIWIGVIAFLGIFVPIILNVNTTKQAEKAEKLSIEAVDKIDAAKEDATQAIGKAEEAKRDSEKALKLLSLVNVSGNLTDIDIDTLRYISKPLKVITHVLKEIHKELETCAGDSTSRIVIDSLRRLAVRLHFLSLYKFIDRTNIEVINGFILFLNASLEKGIDEGSFKMVLSEFQSLIKQLEQSSTQENVKVEEQEKKEIATKGKEDEKSVTDEKGKMESNE